MMTEEDLSPHAADATRAPVPDSVTQDVAFALEPDEAGAILAGKYKLVERIGEGGMGSVWLAQQSEPVKRKVAIKLIKPGMDTRQVLARFEAERQALAMMDHPNIAKVLDGGLTPDNRPFFVMELVKGVPITEYCDSKKLTPRERLELFVPVAQAIQHAHQKGIIHRDIKPSNVLVALYDDKPVPKVIDFGVAKATGQQLTDQTVHTGLGTVVGTPQYMSPEQATFNNLDIDTRSDVYSLGVLLYELLAGSPPFSRKELEAKGYLEILRVVREEEPPKPSTKLSTADALPSLSANRSTEPRKLTALLRSELDWIVLKALEKDRTRRYETANAFAADIQRYLVGEAVHAHPPSTAYRFKKFLRKNSGPVIAAALVALALVCGVVGTTLGLIEANRARRAESARAEGEHRAKVEAEENFDLANRAVEDYLAKVSQDERLKQQDLNELRRQLAESAKGFYAKFLERGRGDPKMRLALGRAFYNLGLLHIDLSEMPEAEKDLKEAEGILEALAAERPDDDRALVRYVETLTALADLYGYQLKRFDAGRAYLEKAGPFLNRLTAKCPDDREAREAEMIFHRTGGGIHQRFAKLQPAEADFSKALELQRGIVSRYPDVEARSQLLRCLSQLGQVQVYRSRLGEARKTLTEGIALAESIAREAPRRGDNRFQWVWQLGLLANLERNANDSKAVEAARRKAVEVSRALAEDLPGISNYQLWLCESLNHLSEFRADRGGVPEALALIDEAVAVAERNVKRFPGVVDARAILAEVTYTRGRNLHKAGRIEEGLACRRKAVADFERIWAEHPDMPLYADKAANSRNGVAFVLGTQNKRAEAVEEGEKAKALYQDIIARFPDETDYRYSYALTCLNLGESLGMLKRYDEAHVAFRAGIKALEKGSAENARWKNLIAVLKKGISQTQADQTKFQPETAPAPRMVKRYVQNRVEV